MNPLKISILTLVISFLISSCGYTETDSSEEVKEDPAKFRKVRLNECVKRIIYNRHSDIGEYDSISTHYFHEFEEYIEKEAIILQKELESIKKLLSMKDLEDPAPYYKKMDSL